MISTMGELIFAAIVGCGILFALIFFIKKQRRSTSVRKKLAESGFEVGHFYTSAITGDYLAIDETARKIAVGGIGQDALQFVEKVNMKSKEAVFTVAQIEFAEKNSELELIEMAGRKSTERLIVFRISLQNEERIEECLSQLRKFGIGPSERLDVHFD